MTPRATRTARRLDTARTHRRMASLNRALSAKVTVAGTPPTLVLTLPGGVGHLYPLGAEPGQMDEKEWDEVVGFVIARPGVSFTLASHPHQHLSPHELLSALLRHAHAANHDYPHPHRLDAWCHHPHGTRTPLRALPGPFPSSHDFAHGGYATREWSWVPPSAHPLITVTAPLNPHV